jgi:hypothetical protein
MLTLWNAGCIITGCGICVADMMGCWIYDYRMRYVCVCVCVAALMGCWLYDYSVCVLLQDAVQIRMYQSLLLFARSSYLPGPATHTCHTFPFETHVCRMCGHSCKSVKLRILQFTSGRRCLSIDDIVKSSGNILSHAHLSNW